MCVLSSLRFSLSRRSRETESDSHCIRRVASLLVPLWPVAVSKHNAYASMHGSLYTHSQHITNLQYSTAAH